MSAELWLGGLVAGLLQVAAGEFAAAAHGTQTSPLRAIGRWLIDTLPTPLIDLGVALLRRADKPVIAATLLLLSLSVATLAALAGRVALVVTLLLLGAIGLAALWRRVELSRVAACGIGLAALAAGVGGVWLSPAVTLVVTFFLAVGVGALRAAARPRSRRLQPALPAPQQPLPPVSVGTALPIPGVSPLFTTPDRFYVTDVTFPTPMVDLHRWQLSVGGLVDHPLVLTYDQLLALPSVEVDAVLMCVHNPVGGPFIGNARWQGVRLADLFAGVGVSRDADHLRLHSVDGFSAGFSLSLIEQGYEPLLAYAMNGVPLRRAHGAPLRLLVPGIHGYDSNIKWLQSIEVTRFELAIDYAERKGWPRVPSRMGPQCRIDVPVTSANVLPGEHVVAGVAWSPPHGVVRVELRIDGGAWRVCTLADALGPCAWRHWSIQWEATSGRHFFEARAWGRDGVQSETIAAPYPEGAGGFHRVEIDVDQRRPPRDRQFAWWLADHVRGRLQLAWTGIQAWRRYRPGAVPTRRNGTTDQ
jgi:DMSO/TMAO reductase YedYZ molybdopterin-dependent catalytic subunit